MEKWHLTRLGLGLEFDKRGRITQISVGIKSLRMLDLKSTPSFSCWKHNCCPRSCFEIYGMWERKKASWSMRLFVLPAIFNDKILFILDQFKPHIRSHGQKIQKKCCSYIRGIKIRWISVNFVFMSNWKEVDFCAEKGQISSIVWVGGGWWAVSRLGII